MRNQYAPEWPIRFQNVSGGEIPAYSVMQCTGSVISNSKLLLEMDQTEAASDEGYFINGPTAIADDGYGSCRSIFDAPFWVAYDSTATPSVGEEWGPEDSNWEMATGGDGYIVLKIDSTNERFLVQPTKGGSCSCPTVYEIYFGGSVTGGTLDLDVGVWDGSSTTTETMGLNYDDTAAEVQTEFETHSKISSGDIEVKGGPLPTAAVYVIFLTSGDRNYDQTLPAINTNSLTGTGVTVKFRYMNNANWEQ